MIYLKRRKIQKTLRVVRRGRRGGSNHPSGKRRQHCLFLSCVDARFIVIASLVPCHKFYSTQSSVPMRLYDSKFSWELT